MGSKHEFQAAKKPQDATEANHAPAATATADAAAMTEAKAMLQIDAAKLNEIAQAFKAKQDGAIQRGPDGSITATFTIPAEIALVVESWAESAGEPLHSFCQQQLEEAFLQFVEGS